MVFLPNFFLQIVSIIVKTLRNTNLVVSRCFKMEKFSLSVDVRRLKMPLPKLPNECLTGLRPHVVYCRLSRSKLDANRAMGPAALSVPDAVTAYRNYTTFIAKAVSAIPGRGLLLDIHGHGHKLQRTELGYLIHGTELDSGAYDGNNSSIKSLSNFWCGNDNACSRKLIRGNWSLGHFMNEEGLRAVPSPQEPVPKVSKTSIFLSGGLTVMKYGSKEEGKIDAIQMELPQELRLSKTAWQDSRLKLAKAISGFFKINYLRDNRRTINL